MINEPTTLEEAVLTIHGDVPDALIQHLFPEDGGTPAEQRNPPDEALPAPTAGVSLQEANVVATGMLARIRRIEAAMMVVNGSARDQIAEIHEWQDGQLEPMQREVDWLRGALEPWSRMLVDADHKHRKSVTLSSGTVGFRSKDSVAASVTDAGQLVDWLLDAAPECVRVKHEPDLVAFKAKYEIRNGHYVRPYTIEAGPMAGQVEYEIIPGVTPVSGPGETFYANAKGHE